MVATSGLRRKLGFAERDKREARTGFAGRSDAPSEHREAEEIPRC